METNDVEVVQGDVPEPTEQDMLMFWQFVYKEAAKQVSTKDPYSLRSMVDAHYMQMFRDTGAKSFQARFMGEDVGSYSIPVSKEKILPQIDVQNAEEYMNWAEENGFTRVVVDEKAVMMHFEATGEQPDGAICSVNVVPPSPSAPRLKLDVEKMRAAIKKKLPNITTRLLED